MGTRALLRKFFAYFLPLSQLHRSNFGFVLSGVNYRKKFLFYHLWLCNCSFFLLKIHHEPKIPIFIYIFFPYNTLFVGILSRYTTRQLEG